MKKLACTLLTSILVFSMTGCSNIAASNNSNNTSDAEVSSQAEVSSDANNSAGADVYAEDGYAEGRFGDVMHTYFFDYTVNSAYTCAEFNGYTPAEGKTLLVADVTVKNTFSESIEMYDTDFQVQWGDDDNDEAYDFPITYYADADAELVSEEQLPAIYPLSVNQEVTGLLVFEVPEGNTDFSISYLELFDDDSEGDTFFVFFTAEQK